KKLHEVSNKLSQKALDEEKQKKHYNAKLACELDKNSRELELKLQRQRDKCRVKEEKIRMVSEIVNSENIQLPNLVRSLSSEQVGHPESKPNPPPKPLDIIATPRVTSRKMPPYRNSKVTHLFKNYFDGEGQVSMIVCVNPRAEDYDENVQVMQFAEMTQQVQIARPSVQKLDVGLSAGRRKANKLFKMAVNNLNDLGHTEAKTLEVDLGLVYTLGPSFPNFQMDSPESNAVINDLMNYLQHRIEKRKALKGDIENRCDNFRMLLMKLEKENLMLKTENATLQADKLNGFEILSQEDALLERQQEMNTRFAKGRRKDSDHEIASQASVEPCAIPGIDEDNMYAVFVTYVEVYNNSVFDLLEETPLNNQKNLQSKIVREDANHNMYVHGVTEIEIKSVEEAIEVFQIGQKRKKTGHTLLNAESSRSHSVFTIRLVQAPTDSQGENVIQNRNVITISQLSLVDLAGSERTNRTKNQ
uniref:Kinesin-like protein n=1 Tax=Megaselia scalaris TaxID=36166 RepID=T1GEH5_MEGSC